MNLMQIVLLVLFSLVGSYAGRYLQGMFAGELGRISSNGMRNLASALIYALGNSVVVFLLASLSGIGISLLFWFFLILAFEFFFNGMRG